MNTPLIHLKSMLNNYNSHSTVIYFNDLKINRTYYGVTQPIPNILCIVKILFNLNIWSSDIEIHIHKHKICYYIDGILVTSIDNLNRRNGTINHFFWDFLLDLEKEDTNLFNEEITFIHSISENDWFEYTKKYICTLVRHA